MRSNELAEHIYEAAKECGFDNCGIISLDALDGYKDQYAERIRNVPSSKSFYKLLEDLNATKERFPWAKSMVICTYWFGKYCYPKELQGRYGKAFFLSPEQGSQDGYDQNRFERWFQEQGIRAEGGEQFSHLSVGPLRYAAVKAGLGIMRKNNFFYTEQGSYTNLIGYVIDRECELIQETDLKPCSEKCDLCIWACKSKALMAPYTMDPLKCVSFWTTFGKGTVPTFLKKDMFEEWICGCDNCQDACPHNRKHNWEEGADFSNLKEIAPLLTPENFQNLTDEYIIQQVITKTAEHLHESDMETLRKCAKRALSYQQENRNKKEE